MRYSRPCPIALAACSSAISVGRTGSASRCTPRAIAPEVTTTTSTPRAVQPGDLLADARDDGQPQLADVVRDDGRAELDDGDGHRGGGTLDAAISGKMHGVDLDLLVIGSGPSGQKAAIQAAKLGKRVAVAERRDRLGGVSIHTGTIPSKTLREAVLDAARRAPARRARPDAHGGDRAAGAAAADGPGGARGRRGDRGGARAVPPQHGRLAAGRAPCFEDDHTVKIEGSDGADPRRADRDRRRARARRGRTPSPSTTARSSTPTACCSWSGGCRAR